MKIKTSELTDRALDWAVAKCWYGDDYDLSIPLFDDGLIFAPSTNWAHGGPIIERECLEIRFSENQWVAIWWADNSGMAKNPTQRFQQNRQQTGQTPLIAAMRAYVASKMGEYVNIPEELA